MIDLSIIKTMVRQDYAMQDIFDKVDSLQKEVDNLQQEYEDSMYNDMNHECPNCGHDL